VTQNIKIYIIDREIKFVIDGIRFSEELTYIFEADKTLSDLVNSRRTKKNIKRIYQRLKECFRIYFREMLDDAVFFEGEIESKKKRIYR